MNRGVLRREPADRLRLDVRGQGFEMTEAIRRYAVERIVPRLVQHGREVEAVVIRLSDAMGSEIGPGMGPKSGTDTRSGIDHEFTQNARWRTLGPGCSLKKCSPIS
jgi:hypothetical protein